MRALAQRRVGLLDLDRAPRAWLSSVSVDRAHRADAPAADLDVVALDQLARVLEQQRVLVGVAAAHEQQRDQDDRQRQRGNGHATGDRQWTLCSLKSTQAVHGMPRAGAGSYPGFVYFALQDGSHSMPRGPREAPERNCRTNMLSELKSSSAGPDSTMRPFHSTAMYSATRLADMMSCVITT